MADDPQGEVEMRVARAFDENGWQVRDTPGAVLPYSLVARVVIAALRPSTGAGEMSDETAKAMDFFSWEYIKKMTRGPDYDSFQLDAAIDYGAALARHIAPGQRASSPTAPAPGVQTEALRETRWVIENRYADPPCYVRIKTYDEWSIERGRDFPKRVAEHVVQETPDWWTFDTKIEAAVQFVREQDAATVMRALEMRAPDDWVRPMEHEWPASLPAPGVREAAPDDGEQYACTEPGGHKFECTGTAYGGDDERWHGEGRSLCIYCGADGDA